MKERVLQKRVGEEPVLKRRFAGRGPLASGLLQVPMGREQQIFHSNVIREAVMTLSQAKDAKVSFQGMVVGAAENIVRARIERDTRPHSENDGVAADGKEQRLLEKVLRKSGAYRVHAVKKTNTGTCFRVVPLGGGEEHMVPLRSDLLEKRNPESEIEGRLEALGVIGPESREDALKKASTRRFECFNPPNIDGLGISQEDLDARKLRYEGELKGIANDTVYHSRSFSYNEESTIEVPAGLTGEELLVAIEGRILRKQVEYAPDRLREKNGEMFDAIQDGAVKAVAKELYGLVWAIDGEAPAEYREAIERLQASREYSTLVDIRNEGVLSAEEIAQFRAACAALDHPARLLIQDMHREQMANDGFITVEGRSMMSDILLKHADKSGLCEEALRNLAEANMHIMGGPERDIWRKESLMKMHFQMMYVIMKAADSLHRALSD